MRHALVALVVCAGCSQVFGLDRPIRALGDGGADARGDGPPVGDGGSCYGSSLVHVCFTLPPSGAVVPPTTIDTEPGSTSCTPVLNTSAWCVIAGGTVTFSQATKIRGSRPLVVVSTGTITVESAVDVASHRGSPTGAGADAMDCSSPVAGPSGGGPGGSFGGPGGAGNAGGDPAAPALQVTALQGGCPGSDGGGSGGSGGHGGGAIYLIAATSISVTAAGTIDASGEGGGGGAVTNGGGGGGGSGGFVGLESPLVTVAGQVYANGGGGGEGADTLSGNAGADPSSATVAAPGGSGGTAKGGDGGVGSAGSVKSGGTGAVGQSPAGGGGGGGGAGVVWFPAGTLMITGAVSPPPT